MGKSLTLYNDFVKCFCVTLSWNPCLTMGRDLLSKIPLTRQDGALCMLFWYSCTNCSCSLVADCIVELSHEMVQLSSTFILILGSKPKHLGLNTYNDFLGWPNPENFLNFLYHRGKNLILKIRVFRDGHMWLRTRMCQAGYSPCQILSQNSWLLYYFSADPGQSPHSSFFVLATRPIVHRGANTLSPDALLKSLSISSNH